MTTRRTLISTALGSSALAAVPVWAQSFPTKPIRLAPAQCAAMAQVDRAKWKAIITERKLSAE